MSLTPGPVTNASKLSSGTILKLPPIGLLLGSVEMGYPLNSTCSDIDTELCVCVFSGGGGLNYIERL